MPELAQRAMATPGAVIIIEHRDYPENLVLTTEGHYRMLEALVEKGATARGAGFKLSGSMSSDLSDDELEAAMSELRAETAAAEQRKYERFLKELR
ncbi:MAG: hypothetical protein WEE89_06070 [Gemmatimonadota bacterium]